MSIYDDMRTDLKELIQMVRQDEQYTSAVAHGVLVPDQQTSNIHQKRACRMDELFRKYDLR